MDMKIIGIISGSYEDTLNPQKSKSHPVYEADGAARAKTETNG